MDPATLLALSGLAQGVAGAVSNSSGQKLTKEQMAQQERQNAAALRQQQGQQALLATQMDPLVQQRSRQKQALIEQLMKGASSPTLNVAAGKFEGGMKYGPEMFKQIASFFTPEARSNAEAQFGLNATAASGGQYALPNAYPNTGVNSAVGYPKPAVVAPTTTAPGAGAGPGSPSFFDEQEERQRRRQAGGVSI